MNYIPSMLIAVQDRNKNNSSGILYICVVVHAGVVRVYSRDYICTSNYTMYTVIKCLSKHCQNGETKEEADGQKAEKTEKQKTENGPRTDVVYLSVCRAAYAKVNADFLVNKRTSGAVRVCVHIYAVYQP